MKAVIAADKPTHAYIGRCEGCGKTLASRVDTRKWPKETGAAVADMIASGLIIERVLLSDAMLDFGGCECPKTVQESMGL